MTLIERKLSEKNTKSCTDLAPEICILPREILEHEIIVEIVSLSFPRRSLPPSLPILLPSSLHPLQKIRIFAPPFIG